MRRGFIRSETEAGRRLPHLNPDSHKWVRDDRNESCAAGWGTQRNMCCVNVMGRCERKPHFGTITAICKSLSVFLDIMKDYPRSPRIFNQLLWHNRHLSINQSKAVSTHCGSLKFAICLDRRLENTPSSLQHLSYETSHFCVFLIIAASLR